MNTEERLRRRATFDHIAETYNAGRPTYPDELYDDLMLWAGVTSQKNFEILEVGCGTGQATWGLLERGCKVTAVELGPRLAAKAAQNLSPFGDNFRVIVGEFEVAELPHHHFDLVASASAFHWIDPAIRFGKVVNALGPEGGLALWGMGNADRQADTPFVLAVKAIQEELGFPARGGHHRGIAGKPRPAVGVEESGLFGPVEIRRYVCDLPYTRDQYLKLLASYSGFQIMPIESQTALIDRVGCLIDEEYGGAVVRRAVATLCLARPLSHAFSR